MQIISKLRVARFVAELKLTPEQRYLVNYHSEYMLFRDDSKSTALNAARYTDHRREEVAGGRDNRIKNNVTKAIDSLDPTKNSIKETYKRIMARNRSAEEDHA